MGTDGEPIDEAVLSRVPADGTWSRMEAWSLSVHGGVWVQERACELLASLGGLRATTRDVLLRAVEAKALDAIQAQAYELLLSSETRPGARFFLRQYLGEFSGWLEKTLGDVRRETLDDALVEVRSALERSGSVVPMARPLRILIAGRPNAGKSTLFNRLVEDERAVVSSVPGTTRDLLKETVVVGGYPVRLSDSAGLRSPESTSSSVERAGIARTRLAARDVVIYLVRYPWQLHEDDRMFLGELPEQRVLRVASVADLAPSDLTPAVARASEELGADVVLAAQSGAGVDTLRQLIADRWLGGGVPAAGELPSAPFTPEQIDTLAALLDPQLRRDALLDAAPRAYIQCRWNSWPPVSAEAAE